MSTFDNSLCPAPPIATERVYPAAVIAKGHWVMVDGSLASTAGVRARGLARQNFSQLEVTAAAAACGPVPSLALTTLGWETTVLGGTIPDNSPVTTDANGATIVAGAGQEVLGFMPKGGDAGDLRAVFVLRSDDARIPSAPIASLTGAGGGTADGALENEGVVSTTGGNTYSDAAVNAVIAKLKNNIAELAAVQQGLLVAARAQKVIAP